MPNKNANRPIPEAFAGYSAHKLQFAIRLGLRPTPEKLREIIRKRPSKQNEISFFIKKLPFI